ncbi:hypothetical protein CEXT_675071 [Caerostris extrusa]|uniref:Uncharacterized protein n=1 Tax=Caerostris extrusa TaxID=172846 RepID=A0AAV4T1E9_CAEEX|nr:hypothetical protein CEXT_675071 [Caerostris extrusa]
MLTEMMWTFASKKSLVISCSKDLHLPYRLANENNAKHNSVSGERCAFIFCNVGVLSQAAISQKKLRRWICELLTLQLKTSLPKKISKFKSDERILKDSNSLLVAKCG